jgi:Domain of unknown function (DUF1818)
MTRQLRSGTGWRLGWDNEPIAFPGLVGGDEWAIEVTAAELEDFCHLAAQLAETMRQMSQELMDKERISCEVESDRLWLEAEGYPHAYDLRLIVLTGRRGEGFWEAAAVPELLRAMQVLKVF